jgi:anhydro-N-acetylmuramic acid kinase
MKTYNQMNLFHNSLSQKKDITVIGLMSGTSLDGLDIALCSFRKEEKWHFMIIDAVTVSYDESLKQRLKDAGNMSAYDIIAFHKQYGGWTGQQVAKFLKEKNINADLMASHGHTVFHEPANRLNLQIGDGAMIAATTGITTVSDFRTLDITLGGQGAPLIPVADRDLFSEYEACVNLGGFANVSLDHNGKRTAWDISPVNFVLNELSRKLGMDFDKNGETGRKGNIIPELFKALEKLNYYSLKAPKSLGAEWTEYNITPLLKHYEANPVENLMATFYEHISERISHDLNRYNVSKALFTGGGAKNIYLMELIQQKFNGEVIIPDEIIIDFKEALGFAYLGLLRALELPNCLSSVTGAIRDSCSGVVHLMK